MPRSSPASASTLIAPAELTDDPAILATTASSRKFSATAPAPPSDTAIPLVPMATDSDTPTALASAGEVDLAMTSTLAPMTVAPPRISAVIVLVTRLVAIATAIDSVPLTPIEPETLPAPTSALTRPEFKASTRTAPPAVTEPPSMAASTWSAWVLLARATATATARDTKVPPETLTLIAITRAVADGVVGVSALFSPAP